MELSRQLMKYPGAKWRIADKIVDLFPVHRSYLEPFLGSGAVLFQKKRSDIETVNDLDGEVVNLFWCIRNEPEKLAREIALTPYSRDVFEAAYANVPDDRVSRAIRFYTRLMMGYGFRTTGERVGWKIDIQGREKAYAAKHWVDLPNVIMEAAERLRMVQIENRPAIDVIQRFNFPNVLIYADPPYLLNTRYGRQYRCEMTDRDHEELLNTLLKHSGSCVISGYQNDMYDSILHGWHKETIRETTQSGSISEEVLWMNYEPEIQLKMNL